MPCHKDIEFASRRGAGPPLFLRFWGGELREADDAVAVLDGLNAAKSTAAWRRNLKARAAGGSFLIAKTDANLFPDLVDER